MINVPLYPFLKLLVSLSAVLWSLLCVWEFFKPPAHETSHTASPQTSPPTLSTRLKTLFSISFMKVIFHGLTWSVLTLYIIFYALATHHIPLTNVAESFVVIAWLFVGGFFIQAIPPRARSLDMFLAPIPTILMIIGANFITTFQQAARTLPPPSILAELTTTLILFSITNYFYAFIIATLYKRSFTEIKKKKALFLTLRLPNLSTLKKVIEVFLIIGTSCFLLIVIIHFILPYTTTLMPETLLESLNTKRLSLPYLIAGCLFSALLIVVKLKRIGHEQLFFMMSFGFLLILLYLFDVI